MSGYYLAPALEVLRAEINQRWPRRDKTSDGWIGDTAHQATRSDHNPNERGSVNAIDVDDDGIDFPTVFAAIKRHPSARYVIYERRLYHRLRGWRSEPYNGSNPHDHHFHLSIDQTRTAEQDRRPWGLIEDTEDDMTPNERWALHVINYRVEALKSNRATVRVPARPDLGPDFKEFSEPNLLAVAVGIDRFDEQALATHLAQLLPAGTAVTDEQLERVLRDVLGSLNDPAPAADR